MAEPTKGMQCTSCGGRLGVASTRADGYSVTRYRKCLQCGLSFITKEEVVRDGRNPQEGHDGNDTPHSKS